MTIENDWYPVCFQNRQQYKEWRYFQRGGGEYCTVCDDCSSEYIFKMLEENRCHPIEAIARTKLERKKKND